jgi:hypothetical protein
MVTKLLLYKSSLTYSCTPTDGYNAIGVNDMRRMATASLRCNSKLEMPLSDIQTLESAVERQQQD